MVIMPPSEIEPTSTPSKEAILDAAQTLLANHGYAGLSMRDLATESGLAKATIYHHFQDKNDLFLSVLARDMTMVHAQIVAAADSSTAAIDKLSAVVRTYIDLMRERRTVIMSVLREMGQDEQILCEFIQSRRHCYFDPIAAILEQGIAEGEFRPVNVEKSAISLVGMINAFVLFRVLTNSDEPVEALIDHTLELFLYGINNRETS